MARRILFLLFILLLSSSVYSQSGADVLRSDIARWVEALKPDYQQVGELRLERTRILPKKHSVEIYLNGILP